MLFSVLAGDSIPLTVQHQLRALDEYTIIGSISGCMVSVMNGLERWNTTKIIKNWN